MTRAMTGILLGLTRRCPTGYVLRNRVWIQGQPTCLKTSLEPKNLCVCSLYHCVGKGSSYNPRMPWERGSEFVLGEWIDRRGDIPLLQVVDVIVTR